MSRRPIFALLRDAIDMHGHTHPALFNGPSTTPTFAQQAHRLWYAPVSAQGSRPGDNRAGLPRQQDVAAQTTAFRTIICSTRSVGHQPARRPGPRSSTERR